MNLYVNFNRNFVNTKSNQISRYGAYGVFVKNTQLLLTLKKSGPYKGLWDLPGGGIEFGESPEETLKREFLEEAALEIHKFEFFHLATSNREFEKNGESCQFHHVGMIYKVTEAVLVEGIIPDEQERWVAVDKVSQEELTPFAAYAVQMLLAATWRPHKRIRTKVIGIAKHNEKILMCEVLDDKCSLKGWCPLGGEVNFGETVEAALKREIYEELGCDITIVGPSIVCENLFDHEEAKGHEIVFAFPIKLNNEELYAKNRFQISEDKGSLHWVEWVPVQKFESSQAIFFPPELQSRILG